MTLNELTAISPVDGRYFKTTHPLTDYFSEYALIKYRVKVEIEYYIALCDLPLPQLKDFPKDKYDDLRSVVLNFSLADAQRIKDIEKTTNHDVKAVEYFIKEKLDALGLSSHKEFIHFGLTSQDINNTSVPLSIKDCNENVLFPEMQNIINKLRVLAFEWKDISMLAKTHGQPASPTKLGKEIYVFFERLVAQERQLLGIPNSAKFGGATGNFNAHHIAYPQIDWIKFANQFVNKTLGLHRSQTTTQIEHYDNLGAYCDALKRINTIFIDLCRDMWTYISMEYFKQKIQANEVGSSAMPHKVNPIDFENAEGNFMLANSMFQFFAGKLPVSRLQRDLTDSTVLRNIGLPIAHTLIAFRSLEKGLDKIMLNEKKINQDLNDNYAVIAEAIQTILRREGYPNPYEKLKELTRVHGFINKDVIDEFINTLDVPKELKMELMQITPHNYTGVDTFNQAK